MNPWYFQCRSMTAQKVPRWFHDSPGIMCLWLVWWVWCWCRNVAERLRRPEGVNISKGQVRVECMEQSHMAVENTGEHRRTPENARDEILHNSISPLGLNPEVHVGNFLYIKQRKTIVRLQQKISYLLPSLHTTKTMPSTPQLSPAKLHQQVEEMKRAWEA